MENTYAANYRRKETLKNVFMGVLIIAVIVLLIVLAGGCEYNPSTTTACQHVAEYCDCDKALVEAQVKNDLLQAELDGVKAELDALKCGATGDAKELASLKAQVTKLTSSANSWKEKYEQANSTAKAWKDKYEAHKCTTSSGSNVDLSKYVLKTTYDTEIGKLKAEISKYEAHKCSTVDMAKYVAKATYDAAVATGKTWENKYNELLKLYNDFVAAHKACGGSTNVNADHTSCVAKSEYDNLNNQLIATQSELNALKATHANCTSVNHSNCVSKATYDAMVRAKNDLEVKYNTLLSEYNNYKANHTNCGNGTTTVYADHSNCVSLTDYKELLAKYNALLGY